VIGYFLGLLEGEKEEKKTSRKAEKTERCAPTEP
jgi:hypothetical protein